MPWMTPAPPVGRGRGRPGELLVIRGFWKRCVSVAISRVRRTALPVQEALVVVVVRCPCGVVRWGLVQEHGVSHHTERILIAPDNSGVEPQAVADIDGHQIIRGEVGLQEARDQGIARAGAAGTRSRIALILLSLPVAWVSQTARCGILRRGGLLDLLEPCCHEGEQRLH